MQFETIAVVIFALALLVFIYARRRVIADLKQEIGQLTRQNEKLRTVAVRQRNEIEGLIHTAEQERRARQMATLAAIGKKPPTKPFMPSPAQASHARKQEEATRSYPSQASSWENPPPGYSPMPIGPSPSQAAAYHGGGGSFDGGGASGDYGRSDSCSTSSSSSSSGSSSSSDSGSSSSSDSGSSCSSSD